MTGPAIKAVTIGADGKAADADHEVIIAPLPAADEPDPAPARSRQASTDDDGDDRQSDTPLPLRRDDKRLSIGRKADSQRLKQFGQERPASELAEVGAVERGPAAAVDEDADGTEEILTGRAPAPQPKKDAVASRAAAADDDDPLVDVVVDGRRAQKRLSEVTAAASQHYNDRERLSRATRALEDERRDRHEANRGTERAPARDDDPANTGKTEAASGKTAKRFEPTQLRSLAEKIQTGLADDGATELAKFANDIADAVRADMPSLSDTDVADAVQRALAQREQQTEQAKLVNGFVADFPEIGKDEVLQQATYQTLNSSLIGHMRRIGVSEKELTVVAEQAKKDPTILGRVYSQLQRGVDPDGQPYPADMTKNWRLPTVAAVLKASGKHVMAKYGGAAASAAGADDEGSAGKENGRQPVRLSKDRQGRTATVGAQPRAASAKARGAGGRLEGGGQGKPVTVEESRKNGFLKIRSGRAGVGQPRVH